MKVTNGMDMTPNAVLTRIAAKLKGEARMCPDGSPLQDELNADAQVLLELASVGSVKA